MAAAGQIVAKDAFLTVEDSAGTTRNIGGDTNTVTLSRSAETPDVTAFGDTTRNRITGGLKDWTLTGTSFFNDTASTGIETIMDGILGGATLVDFGPAGSQDDYQQYTGCAVLSEYSIESPVDNVVALTYTLMARSGSLTSGSYG